MLKKNNQPASAPYSTGYGKPPKHAQFKKGTSGNPKGRPKGSKNLSTKLQTAFGQHVSMSKNGKVLKVEIIDALLTKLFAKALNGDHAAMKMAFDLYGLAYPAVNDNQTTAEGSSFELTPEELVAIEKLNLLKGLK